jgi:hypothetical protein
LLLSMPSPSQTSLKKEILETRALVHNFSNRSAPQRHSQTGHYCTPRTPQ